MIQDLERQGLLDCSDMVTSQTKALCQEDTELIEEIKQAYVVTMPQIENLMEKKPKI